MKHHILALAALSTGLTANAASIVNNGSFETTSASFPVGWATGGYTVATGGALLAHDGVNRMATDNNTTVISQLTGTSPTVGDILTLDFWGNANNVANRGWTATVVLDGGAGTKVTLGSMTLIMNTSPTDWEEANIGGLTTFTVTALNIATAGGGAKYGVEIVGAGSNVGFKGLDSVSLEVTSVPEPSALGLIGLFGGAALLRRRTNIRR